MWTKVIWPVMELAYKPLETVSKAGHRPNCTNTPPAVGRWPQPCGPSRHWQLQFFMPLTGCIGPLTQRPTGSYLRRPVHPWLQVKQMVEHYTLISHNTLPTDTLSGNHVVISLHWHHSVGGISQAASEHLFCTGPKASAANVCTTAQCRVQASCMKCFSHQRGTYTKFCSHTAHVGRDPFGPFTVAGQEML